MGQSSRCRFIYTPDYFCDIGTRVFPMQKYGLVRDRLIEEGVPESAFSAPEPASRDDLLLVHTPRYLDDLFACRWSTATSASELPIAPDIVRGFRLAAGGSSLACRLAIENGVAMNLAGGFHHAFADHAEGFCYINDVAYAVRLLRAEGAVERAVVVDLDVHQGNGTAAIFQSEPEVFTFSMHQENNYPLKRRSDLDDGLPDGIGDEEYLQRLQGHLRRILDEHRPGLVLYVAGVDVYGQDLLGGLSLTLEGMRARDAAVVEACRERGIPVAGVLAGGYAQQIEDTVRAHLNTARLFWEAGCRPLGGEAHG